MKRNRVTDGDAHHFETTNKEEEEECEVTTATTADVKDDQEKEISDKNKVAGDYSDHYLVVEDEDNDGSFCRRNHR